MKLLPILICSALLLFVTPPPALAQELRQGENVVVGSSEVINQDLFAAGESVTVSGTVNGDAYIGAGNILVDGVINGDLLVAGGSITVRGPVRNNIRVFGGNISLGSTVGGNITFGGGNLQITDAAQISGSISGGGGNVEVFAPVGRGVTVGVGQLRLGNNVGGNVVAGVGQLSLASGAKVEGDVSYWSDKQVELSGGATVAGQLVRHVPPQAPQVDQKKAAGAAFAGLAGVVAAFKFIEFIGVFLIGLLIIKVTPNFVKNAVSLTADSPWKALLTGFVAVIVAPIAILVLFLTAVGAPLALVMIALLGILCFLTKIFTAIFVGTKVLEMIKQKGNMYGAFALGLVLLTLVVWIPVLGWVIGAALYLTALGGLILSKSKLYTQLRSKELI